jgi:hypothetical protein
MHCGGRSWHGDVTNAVILKPVLLVCCIKSHILVMQRKKLDKKAAVLEAQWQKSSAVGKCDMN